jgi:hypothetical protein
MAGYSGVSLQKKLGFKPPLRVVTYDAPPDYGSWLGELPEGVSLVSRHRGPIRAAHVFAKRRATLEQRLGALRKDLDPTGFVWASWPKKASKIETDITDIAVREVALPMGFVDVKVCAVTDVWSGLKLVIRRSERPK